MASRVNEDWRGRGKKELRSYLLQVQELFESVASEANRAARQVYKNICLRGSDNKRPKVITFADALGKQSRRYFRRRKRDLYHRHGCGRMERYLIIREDQNPLTLYLTRRMSCRLASH